MLATHRLYSLRVSERTARWLILCSVFCGSVIVAVLFWAVLPESIQVNESSDYAAFYEPVARSIVAGRGLVLPDGSPATTSPPGFPVLLAGVFHLSALFSIPEGIAVRAFIVLCMELSSVLLFAMADDIWGIGPAVLVAVLWMTYPFALWLTKQPNSELPFVFVLYAGLALFARSLLRGAHAWHRYVFSGLLIGFSALIRPIAVGVGPICAILSWLALRKQAGRLRRFLVGCLIFGYIVAIMPWELWMFANTGQVVLLSTSGTSSVRDGLSFAIDAKSYRQETAVPADVLLVMHDVLLRARNGELESFPGVASVLSQELRTHPLATFELLLLKVARSWFGTDSGRYETPILLVQLFYLALISLGAFQTWKQGGLDRQLVVSTSIITLYFWGMTVMALSILRYMVPTIGLLFLLVPGTFSKQGAVVKDPHDG